MQPRSWTTPTVSPILCMNCYDPLKPDEVEYLEVRCERCEIVLHDMMRDEPIDHPNEETES